MQISDRKFFIGGRDYNLEAKEDRIQKEVERKATQKRRWEKVKEEEKAEQMSSWSGLEEVCGEEEGGEKTDASHDGAYEPRRVRRRVEIPPLEMPKDILSRPKVAQAATRIQLTAQKASFFLAAVIEESGGDLNNYSLSPSNTHKRKRKNTRKIAMEVKKNYNPPKLRYHLRT